MRLPQLLSTAVCAPTVAPICSPDGTPTGLALPPWLSTSIQSVQTLLHWQQLPWFARGLLGLLLIPLGLLMLRRLADLLPAVSLLLARTVELALRLPKLVLALLRELFWVDPARRAARHARWRPPSDGEPALANQLLLTLLDLLLLPIDWLATVGPQRLFRPDPGAEAKQQRRVPEEAPLLPRLGWVLGRHVNPVSVLSLLRLLQPRCWLPGFFWRWKVVKPDSYGEEFPIGGVLWLTLAADVREVLGRPDRFEVVYGPRMRRVTQPIEPAVDHDRDLNDSERGNFLLGMQDTPRYWRDSSNMRLAFRREDAAVCGRLAERAAITALQAALKHPSERPLSEPGPRLCRINLPAQLVTPVAEALVREYFGLPVPLRCPPQRLASGAEAAAGGAAGAALAERDGAAELLEDHNHRWLETLFNHIFYDIKGDASLESCLRDAPRVRGALREIIQQRKRAIEAAPAHQADDVLGRCLRLQEASTPGMDDETIRVNLTGFLVGAMTPLINATCQVVDVLLEHPAMLARAQHAAAACDQFAASSGDRSGNPLLPFVMEALRFSPGDPVIWRWTNADTAIGAGSRRCTVPAGTLVMAWNSSAMFDPAVVSAPWSFRTDRPSGAYMHWGHGQHSCAGAYINMAVIPAMLLPLLRKKQLQRAPGAAGQPRMDEKGGITIRQFELLVHPEDRLPDDSSVSQASAADTAAERGGSDPV